MTLNHLAGQLIADVLFDDDTGAAATLAEILGYYDFAAQRIDTDVRVELGAHQVVVTARQVREIVAGAVALASETSSDPAIPLAAAVRAQLHLLSSLLQEVADCGRTHALLEVTR